MSAEFDELKRALADAGIPRNWTKIVKGFELELHDPVSIIANTRLDASPVAEILLHHAKKLTDSVEVESVVRCMSQKPGFSEAVPWLLSLFHNYPANRLSEGCLWAAGNSVYTIDEKKFYYDVLAICQDRRFGSSRQMLMGTLARMKSDAAFELLTESLTDPTVRAHAIEGIGRFGRVDAIATLERLEVEKGLYEWKAKATALRRLARIRDRRAR